MNDHVVSARPEIGSKNDFIIFGGTANPALTAAIMREWPGACVVDRYPDGDVSVQFLDSVRRKDVYLVQPTSPPINDQRLIIERTPTNCS